MSTHLTVTCDGCRKATLRGIAPGQTTAALQAAGWSSQDGEKGTVNDYCPRCAANLEVD